MKKKYIKILIPLATLITITTSTFVYATNNNLKFNKSTIIISENKENYKKSNYWASNVYLDNEDFCNITTFNNFFDDNPIITNQNNYPITIRAVNEQGELVCKEQTLKSGETIQFENIKYNKGNITFQAKAEQKNTYFINII